MPFRGRLCLSRAWLAHSFQSIQQQAIVTVISVTVLAQGFIFASFLAYTRSIGHTGCLYHCSQPIAMGFFALFLIELESILSMGGGRGAGCISSTRRQNYADYQAWWLSEAMRDTYGRVVLGTGAVWEQRDRAAIVPPALDQALSAVADDPRAMAREWVAAMPNPLVLFAYGEDYFGGISYHASLDNIIYYVLHVPGDYSDERSFWNYYLSTEIYVRQIYRVGEQPRPITVDEYHASPFTMYYVTPGYPPIQSAAEDEDDEDYDEVVATNAVESIVEPIHMAAEDEDREEVVATNGVESIVEPIQGGEPF